MKHLLCALLLGTSGLAGAQSTLKFSDLIGKTTVRGVELGAAALKLQGQTVEMRGYMAPPLKPKLDFFVLTKRPMATCPFCSSAAEWPPDIVLVIMPPGQELNPSIRTLKVTGRLDLGVKQDEETGFVSLIRIYASKVSEE